MHLSISEDFNFIQNSITTKSEKETMNLYELSVQLQKENIKLQEENIELKNKLKQLNNLNLKRKQKDSFKQISFKFADHGFNTFWVENNWNEADFIAIDISSKKNLKVKIKDKLSFNKCYINQDIYICFKEDTSIYFYPHDLVLNQIDNNILDEGWIKQGLWSSQYISIENKKILEPYKL